MDFQEMPDGETLQKLAYAQDPISPAGLAVAVIAVSLALCIISTIAIVLRVIVKLWGLRTGVGWDWADTFALLGWAAFIASGSFAVKSSYYGLGTKDEDLNDLLKIRASEYMLYSQITYGVSMPLIKASIVFTLLAITDRRRYRWPLYGMVGVATVMAIVGIVASLTYCTPVKAYWNPLLGECGDFMRVVRIGYAWTAVGIATDWMTAILPWFIIRNLQMPRRTKFTVMAILSIGGLASVASVIRAPYLQYYLATSDQLYWNGFISIWCLVESGLGLIAATLPALRRLFKRILERSANRSKGPSGQRSGGENLESAAGGGVALRTIGGSELKNGSGSQKLDTISSGAKGSRNNDSGHTWERLEDETSSSKAIMYERYGETDSMSDGTEGKSHR